MTEVGAPIRRQGPARVGPILDRSVPGRRAWSLPALDVPEAPVAQEHARTTSPRLPEVGEVDLVRHYTDLAQRNYGLDTGMYPLGSCTMKYNPKVAETVAGFPGFQRLHPLQPASTTQGVLELLWRLEHALCAITGMARATLQPPAGACGEMTGLLLMRAYHEDRGDPRRRVIIPDSAHGTNPASVRLAGYEAVPVRSGWPLANARVFHPACTAMIPSRKETSIRRQRRGRSARAAGMSARSLSFR